VAPKSKPLPNDQKIVFNLIKACEIRFICQMKNQALILFVGITYSMRDILSDLNNYMPNPQTSNINQIRQMMSVLPLASARLNKLRILCLNNLLDGDLRQNIFYFHILSFWF